jgi:hypothetical protein
MHCWHLCQVRWLQRAPTATAVALGSCRNCGGHRSGRLRQHAEQPSVDAIDASEHHRRGDRWSDPTTPSSLTPSPSPTSRPLIFVATGKMHTAREGATATLLKNGKVLIAGGEDLHDVTNTYYASAEIYDPATGKFTTTGSMTAARGRATAVLLSDGRVLIAGGDGCSDPRHCTNIDSGATESLVSADIYDPTTGKFTRTGSMTEVTNGPAAVLLPDGKVLIAAFEPGAELFDPVTGKFTKLGEGISTSPPNTATLLPNGKVLLVNGEGAPQLYDEATGKLTTISLALPPGTPSAKYKDGRVIDRVGPDTATLLPDGRVLLFESGYLETYDPATGACADAGFIAPGVQWIYPTATLLHDGRVLFEGGGLVPDPVAGHSPSTNIAVLYDPTSGKVSTGSMSFARQGQTATLLLDGSVLIAGGQDANYKVLASAELFKP